MATHRDLWIRRRFSKWLLHCLAYDRVSINSISKLLAGNTFGDYRGAIRAYCREDATVSADRAFEIGEAVATLAPGCIDSGPLAVCIAGYYDEFIAFLEAFLALVDEPYHHATARAAIQLPFLAEVLLAKLQDDIHTLVFASYFTAFAGRAKYARVRLLQRAWNFAALANVARASSDSTTDLPVAQAWQSRREPPTSAATGFYAGDRRALIDIARALAAIPSLQPERASAVTFAILWQWKTLADANTSSMDELALELLSRYHDQQAGHRYYAANLDKYKIVDWDGNRLLVPKQYPDETKEQRQNRHIALYRELQMRKWSVRNAWRRLQADPTRFTKHSAERAVLETSLLEEP
jgi:hypothetical protein